MHMIVKYYTHVMEIHYEIKKNGTYENPYHHLVSNGGAKQQDYAELYNP